MGKPGLKKLGGQLGLYTTVCFCGHGLCNGKVQVNNMHICDWILEKQSKSHIKSFEINGFSQHDLPRIANTCKKFKQKDASIYYLSGHFQYV